MDPASTSISAVVELPTSRRKAAALLLLGLVLTGVSAWLTTQPGTKAQIAGWIGAVLFGAGAGYSLMRVLRPGIALRIDDLGIVDRASAIGVGRVRWDEISRVMLFDFQGQRMLGIEPRDLDAFLDKLSPWRRTLLRCNVQLGAAPISIPGSLLPVPLEEVHRLVRQRMEARSAAGSGPEQG